MNSTILMSGGKTKMAGITQDGQKSLTLSRKRNVKQEI